jgi:divalent metal cation (Fe/Co/Zn/Cd) transporter
VPRTGVYFWTWTCRKRFVFCFRVSISELVTRFYSDVAVDVDPTVSVQKAHAISKKMEQSRCEQSACSANVTVRSRSDNITTRELQPP